MANERRCGSTTGPWRSRSRRPGQQYELSLNGGSFHNFASNSGEPAESKPIRFFTRIEEKLLEGRGADSRADGPGHDEPLRGLCAHDEVGRGHGHRPADTRLLR